MRSAFAPLALAAMAAANPMPQGVTSAIAPEASAPAGCSADYSGTFEIATVMAEKSKRDLSKRADPLMVTLKSGVLTDAKGRTGYIADNYQFQFDGPAQTGAIYTAGWSICGNGTLALGGSAIFYECLSGEFYNLYNKNVADQCVPIYIETVPVDSNGNGIATQITDGQVQGTPAPSPVCQIGDGQVQQTNCVTQITDGQIQAPTATGAPVTQITDGQIQAPTATANPVTQIGDGQIQAPTGVVSQITDGQIQAPTTGPVVSQINDGQIQAPVSAGTMMPTASTNGTVASATPTAYTGGATSTAVGGQLFGLAAGVLAVAFL